MIFPRLIIKWERWKFNKELGIYVSNMGNFKTAKKKPITPKTKDDRYLHIKLPHSGYVIRAHVAVMKTWKPLDSYEDMTVDHIDANHRNNELSNLEWVTKEENMRRAETNSLVTPKKNKKKTVKITVTSYTLDQFYLLADGVHFNSLEDLYEFTGFSSESLQNGVKNRFQTLLNAYNHQDPVYKGKNYEKIFEGHTLALVKKGA